MLGIFRTLLYRLGVSVKFRGMSFSAEGSGCVYKALSSNFSYPQRVTLGTNVHIGPGAMFDGAGGIVIGDGSVFAPGVKIFSRSHNFDEDVQALPFDNVVLVAPVHVGRYVWIGADVIILPGVRIGDGAVIGAGAVVARDIPRCAIAVGNPAKVVKMRDTNRFEELLREDGAFVYQKFGHGKVMREKGRRSASQNNED